MTKPTSLRALVVLLGIPALLLFTVSASRAAGDSPDSPGSQNSEDEETPSYNLPLNVLDNPAPSQPVAKPATAKAGRRFPTLPGHSPAPVPVVRAPELLKTLLPLDAMAAAVCANVCTAPILPFNGVILLKACESAIMPAGGDEALARISAKSPEIAKKIEDDLLALGIDKGLQGIVETKRDTADFIKPRACAASVLFAVIAGARKAGSGRVKESDFACLKGGLTDGGCNYSSAQIASEPDAKFLFGSGIDRAVSTYFGRFDAKVLAQKLSAAEPPSGGVDYLAEGQEGEFSTKDKALFQWGHDHATEVLSQLRAPR